MVCKARRDSETLACMAGVAGPVFGSAAPDPLLQQCVVVSGRVGCV